MERANGTDLCKHSDVFIDHLLCAELPLASGQDGEQGRCLCPVK